ncbi:hypothetical protein [Roseibium aggregatum]|uniref:Uncharacterized protein n=1 Tax=Roseibium aggregatum TaxID=187304 RepID=A0A926NXR1_9HYPH|nr:hypothetical protein [Roseibium aggregatum]MBD1549327.1 hypothetical protein [Roseibium aggregatum]
MTSGKDNEAPVGKAQGGKAADNAGSSAKKAASASGSKTQSREERLAEALRANLRRRKSAAKGRKAED